MVEAPTIRQTATSAALAVPRTPSMVCHVDELRRTASRIQAISREAGCTLLYSVKANALPGVLTALTPFVDGCGVSSLNEARAARKALGEEGMLHLCAVAVPPDEADELADICDYVTFNSISQLEHWGPVFAGNASIGLRVNPGHSFVDDRRYDPCRRHSKLGVSPDDLAACSRPDCPVDRRPPHPLKLRLDRPRRTAWKRFASSTRASGTSYRESSGSTSEAATSSMKG